MKVGYQGGRAGVPSWCQPTDSIWNFSKRRAEVVKLVLAGDAQQSGSCDSCCILSDIGRCTKIMNNGLLTLKLLFLAG